MRERTPFPKSLIDRLPNLRFVTTTAARNRALDIGAFSARQIPVVSALGGSGVASGTTEHTWALILGALKGLARDHTAIMAGAGRERDKPWQTATNPAIDGQATLGLVGFGRLGQALLPVARALAFKSVVAWSPNLTAERIADAGPLAEGVELASSLDDLLERADIVSLHLVSSPSTRHIIGAAELDKMRPGAILVNTSRGALVDTDALVAALRDGKIGGAALDVYEEEPLTSGNPFEGLTNVTCVFPAIVLPARCSNFVALTRPLAPCLTTA
jgi:phosphoglycerate dehydrogenase-like enzyme